jgi:beta-galactosidase
MASLLNTAWTGAAIAHVEVPTGVEVVRRQGTDRSFLFVLNHGDAEARVSVGPGVDMLSGDNVGPDGLLLPPYGVAVIAK